MVLGSLCDDDLSANTVASLFASSLGEGCVFFFFVCLPETNRIHCQRSPTFVCWLMLSHQASHFSVLISVHLVSRCCLISCRSVLFSCVGRLLYSFRDTLTLWRSSAISGQ